ncbi:MAG TPA: helix-turn-helix transcriptional regulator [Jatrophihabitans sp.]|uniref:helix-turn-helix transcriptional regulator n=1 Tax=Jatrophihabitans sp. TaxID=1932789 RepID=UPI002EE6CF9F
MQTAVERVITSMWERYDEPLSLEEMADLAVFSRFYFSRVFRGITGTSPGRFLTAIRLYKAKNLLLETTMSVTDISYQVGYNSPGTFSSRFTRSVSISPARYRYLSEVGIPAPQVMAATGQRLGGLRGTVTAPEADVPMRVYVSLFDSAIPQGTPVAYAVLDGAESYQLNAVPEGQWFLHATAVAVRDLDPRPWTRRPVSVAAGRPIRVVAGRTVTANIELRPPRLTDLPILLALPELDSRTPAAPAVVDARPAPGQQRRSAADADSSTTWAGSSCLVVG